MANDRTTSDDPASVQTPDQAPVYKQRITDVVGGPFTVVIFFVLLAITFATFAVMFYRPDSVPYAFGFMGSCLIPLIIGYQGYQGYKTRKTIHNVANQINEVSRQTTDTAVCQVVKDVKKVVTDTVNLKQLSGPEGPKGEQGDQGVQGEQGKRGRAGKDSP